LSPHTRSDVLGHAHTYYLSIFLQRAHTHARMHTLSTPPITHNSLLTHTHSPTPQVFGYSAQTQEVTVDDVDKCVLCDECVYYAGDVLNLNDLVHVDVVPQVCCVCV
jgi:hypothetical protein